jgi:hypothetical protein
MAKCYECGYKWENTYNYRYCLDCGASNVSPHKTEDHPDYDPQEVYVVLEMYKGVICWVDAYKNDPDPFNEFKYDREEDNGTRVFIVDVNQRESEGEK